MSPETPARPTPYTLADALAAVGQGDFSHRVLVSFSDLNRDRAQAFARLWPGVELEHRIRLIQALDDLSESSIHHNFSRVFRVGLTDEDSAVRQRSAAALWEDESTDLIDQLIQLLEDPSQDVRAEAAKALGNFAVRGAAGDLSDEETESIFVCLERLADSGDESLLVRRRALEAVAAFGKQGSIQQLIRDAYDDEDQTLRAGALYAMGRSMDGGWLSTVLYELDNDDPEMRYEAARACGVLGDNRAVEGLARLTSDTDAEVRFAAVSALGRIASPGAERVLRRLAERASGEDRDAIEEALEVISAMDFSD